MGGPVELRKTKILWQTLFVRYLCSKFLYSKLIRIYSITRQTSYIITNTDLKLIAQAKIKLCYSSRQTKF